jgi:hypothetical protein
MSPAGLMPVPEFGCAKGKKGAALVLKLHSSLQRVYPVYISSVALQFKKYSS